MRNCLPVSYGIKLQFYWQLLSIFRAQMLASQPYHLSGPKEQRLLLRTDRHVLIIRSSSQRQELLSNWQKRTVTTGAVLLKLISLSI